jgi:exonuclease SbcD
VIIIDKITTKFDTGDYEYFSILESKPGFIKLSINGEKLSIVTIPYVSESRLNELIYNSSSTEKDMQKSYSDKIESLINEACTNYEQDSINIAVGHFYIVGGEQSRSERDIELGGIFSVSSSALPMSAQYVAMGHLHRAQNIKNNIYYSGSPIQYSKKEAHIAKSVYVVDIKTNIEADVVRVLLRNYKPIHLISADSVERAVDKIKALGDHQCYLYIDIKVDDYISMEDIKLMRSLNEDIIEIRPIRSVCHTLGKKHAELGGDIVNDFKDFYKSIRYAEPHEDLLKLFNRLVAEVEEDET